MPDVWIILIMLIIGFLMLMFEVLTPSFGILSAIALACFAVAVYFGFRINSIVGVGMIVGLVVAVPVYYFILFRYVAKTRFVRKLFLKPLPLAAGEGIPAAQEYESYVGMTGTSETQLRPSGAVRIDGRRVTALAESGVIEKGKTVKVLRVDGMSLIVKETPSAASDAAKKKKKKKKGT